MDRNPGSRLVEEVSRRWPDIPHERLAAPTLGWWRRHQPDEEAAAILERRWAARLARMDAHLERIDRTAWWLGQQLARHDITRADADRRLGALCAVEDAEARPVRVALVPWDIAHDHAVAALRRGLDDRRRPA